MKALELKAFYASRTSFPLPLGTTPHSSKHLDSAAACRQAAYGSMADCAEADVGA
jgi:hypothetical protein